MTLTVTDDDGLTDSAESTLQRAAVTTYLLYPPVVKTGSAFAASLVVASSPSLYTGYYDFFGSSNFLVQFSTENTWAGAGIAPQEEGTILCMVTVMHECYDYARMFTIRVSDDDEEEAVLVLSFDCPGVPVPIEIKIPLPTPLPGDMEALVEYLQNLEIPPPACLSPPPYGPVIRERRYQPVYPHRDRH